MSGIEFDATACRFIFILCLLEALEKYFQNGSAVLVAMDEYIVLWCCFCFVFVIVFFFFFVNRYPHCAHSCLLPVCGSYFGIDWWCVREFQDLWHIEAAVDEGWSYLLHICVAAEEF